MKDAKIIAVYGESGVGKTMAVLALSNQLTRLGGQVIIVSADTLAPALDIVAPGVEHNYKDCLGTLIQKPMLTYGTIMEYVTVHPDNDNIGILAFSPETTPETYKITPDAVFNLLTQLKKISYNLEENSPISDYIIVDCMANPLGDAISRTAMECADFKICMITPDIKGIAYYRAMKVYLQADVYEFGLHLIMGSEAIPESPIAEVQDIIGNFDFVLPYSKEAKVKYAGGQIPTGFVKRGGLSYEREMKRCAEMLTGMTRQKLIEQEEIDDEKPDNNINNENDVEINEDNTENEHKEEVEAYE